MKVSNKSDTHSLKILAIYHCMTTVHRNSSRIGADKNALDWLDVRIAQQRSTALLVAVDDGLSYRTEE